ncbi:MAG TPA: AbrB/MazE/SpoVT family DNA-binding domain-containing protein [Leptolyngbyaceae cyanobacterium]
MGATIRTRIVKVGNSQGIRIPKPLLEQSGIDKEVEIEVHEDRLIIRAARRSRVGWDEAFAAMAELKDDVLLDDAIATTWDSVEWEW